MVGDVLVADGHVGDVLLVVQHFVDVHQCFSKSWLDVSLGSGRISLQQ